MEFKFGNKNFKVGINKNFTLNGETNKVGVYNGGLLWGSGDIYVLVSWYKTEEEKKETEFLLNSVVPIV